MKLSEILNCNYEIHIKNNKDENKVEIKGNSIDLLVGIAFLSSRLKEAGIKADDIKFAVELGLQDEKETERQAKEHLKEMLNKLF